MLRKCSHLWLIATPNLASCSRVNLSPSSNERATRIDSAPWRNYPDENPNSSVCQRPIRPDDLRVVQSR